MVTNINCLQSNNKKNQLDNLLGTYNLIDTVFFFHKNSKQFSHTNW
jgi:hypothetical protein